VIPLKMEENGTISEHYEKCLKNRLQGNHEITELQRKTTILGTAHILQKVLI
jgi:hypothetical protein